MSEQWLTMFCECGARLTTNDDYLFDDIKKLWNEWHEEGSFIAGKYHRSKWSGVSRPLPAADARSGKPSD